MLHLYLIVCSLLSIASARLAFRFAAGFEDLIGEPDRTFSCEDKIYGYYADVQNDCRVFHVCHPILNTAGEVTAVDHYSFVCGNQTVFSQESLTCADPEFAYPCADSPSLYELVNAEFGRILGRAADIASAAREARVEDSSVSQAQRRPSVVKPAEPTVQEKDEPEDQGKEEPAGETDQSFGLQVEDGDGEELTDSGSKQESTAEVADEAASRK